MQGKKVCIFVDGENLRHSIVDLFPTFDRRTYLPRADWAKFFDWITQQVMPDSERVRAYWYVVDRIDFSPSSFGDLRKNSTGLKKFLCRDEVRERQLTAAQNEPERSLLIEKMASEIETLQREMEKRFFGWGVVHDAIEFHSRAVEFRKAGTIRYDLLRGSLGDEKAVDVKLGTDLIMLKDVYDIAVIVSGDQDYVPAVDAIKDFGKHAVNVAFQKEDGYVLPSGAKRLNQATDWNIEIKHADLKTHLGL